MAVDVAPGQAVRRRQLRRTADVLPLTPEAAAERFGLGPLRAPPEPRHGGVNQLWRVRTKTGEFAVHRMHPRPHLAERCDAVMAIERAAAVAGVTLAEPVPDPATGRAAVDGVVVHRWVDAEPVHPDRTTPPLYRVLGRSLAHIHGLAAPAPPSDGLNDRPTAADWRAIAEAAAERDLRWAGEIGDAADDLADAFDVVDSWDRAAGEPAVVGHRDLTSMNVLDLDGTPVLIDWEDAGPIAPGTELGRTALDNVGRHGVLDPLLLTELVGGYREVREVPPPGPHWCSLWVLGLVVFAAHCARSCIEGTAGPSLLRLQSEVVGHTPAELRRRLATVDAYVGAFEKASRNSS